MSHAIEPVFFEEGFHKFSEAIDEVSDPIERTTMLRQFLPRLKDPTPRGFMRVTFGFHCCDYQSPANFIRLLWGKNHFLSIAETQESLLDLYRNSLKPFSKSSKIVMTMYNHLGHGRSSDEREPMLFLLSHLQKSDLHPGDFEDFVKEKSMLCTAILHVRDPNFRRELMEITLFNTGSLLHQVFSTGRGLIFIGKCDLESGQLGRLQKAYQDQFLAAATSSGAASGHSP